MRPGDRAAGGGNKAAHRALDAVVFFLGPRTDARIVVDCLASRSTTRGRGGNSPPNLAPRMQLRLITRSTGTSASARW